MSREPCIKCGVSIATDHGVSLPTVMAISRLPADSLVDKIVEREQIPRELAQEIVDHKMGRRCNKTEPPCPNCGAPLKTWHATGCWGCGWRRDPEKHLPEYYR